MNKTLSKSPVHDYLYQEAGVILFVLDKDGYVLDVNQYTKDVVGNGLSQSKQHLYDILVNFGNLPPFSELIQPDESPKMLNITTPHGLPQTFYFTFYEEEDRIFAFGQTDPFETETMRKNLLDANQEINNLARELQKSNVQLTQLNAMKNQFLGMAAHDLRNPIGIVLQYSEFLLNETKSLLSGSQTEMLKRITDSSNFMLRLLNDLLDISKIESGKLELSLFLTDFVPFAERNILLNQVLAEKKQIKLIFRGEEHLPSLMIDPPKIEQVLNNLISNAVKYSFPNTVVEISVSQRGEDMIVSVRDEGQGIPEKEASKLFQAFQTTSVKSTAGEKSTGLGLMITKKIITGHQGKIWAESTPGKGSVFYFTLPIPREELEKMKHVPPASPAEAQEKKPDAKEPAEKISDKEALLPSMYLDQDVIDNYRNIDPGFLNELIEMFLEQSSALIGELHEAIENKEWDSVSHLTDQLRGASDNLGARQLEQLCNEMLELNIGEDGADFDHFLSQLDNIYEPTKQALQEIMSQ